MLDKDTVDFREVDYIKYADKKVIIPIYEMSQSLNVSVTNAVILYEAERQKKAKGMYEKPQLSNDIIEKP